MGAPADGTGIGGCGLQDVVDIIQGSSKHGDTLWVGDVGAVPMYQEDAGQVSPLGDPTADREIDKTPGI